MKKIIYSDSVTDNLVIVVMPLILIFMIAAAVFHYLVSQQAAYEYFTSNQEEKLAIFFIFVFFLIAVSLSKKSITSQKYFKKAPLKLYANNYIFPGEIVGEVKLDIDNISRNQNSTIKNLIPLLTDESTFLYFHLEGKASYRGEGEQYETHYNEAVQAHIEYSSTSLTLYFKFVTDERMPYSTDNSRFSTGVHWLLTLSGNLKQGDKLIPVDIDWSLPLNMKGLGYINPLSDFKVKDFQLKKLKQNLNFHTLKEQLDLKIYKNSLYFTDYYKIMKGNIAAFGIGVGFYLIGTIFVINDNMAGVGAYIVAGFLVFTSIMRTLIQRRVGFDKNGFAIEYLFLNKCLVKFKYGVISPDNLIAAMSFPFNKDNKRNVQSIDYKLTAKLANSKRIMLANALKRREDAEALKQVVSEFLMSR